MDADEPTTDLWLVFNQEEERVKLKISIADNHFVCPFCERPFTQENLWQHWHEQTCSKHLGHDFSICTTNEYNALDEANLAKHQPKKVRCYEDAIFYACQDHGPDSTKKRTLMLADCFDITPIGLIDSTGEENNMMMSPELIPQLQKSLQNPPLRLSIPPKKRQKVDIATINVTTIKNLADRGSISNFLTSRRYTELDERRCAILNKDWVIYPQYRYAAAKALSGAVIIDEVNKRGLLINTIEVYGRDKSNETHYEQYSLPSQRLSSVPPPHNTQYKDLLIRSFQQADGKRTITKLIIGTRSFSALITSSIRIDVHNGEPECGPNTTKFVLDEVSSASSKLYLDDTCWDAAMQLTNDPKADLIETFDILAQLRQIRTKFHRIGTYEASRASLLNEPLCRPLTVFTYRSHGNEKMTDGKAASSILATMAIQIIRHKSNASLERDYVESLHKDVQERTRVGTALSAILKLYSDAPEASKEIRIIGNDELNEQAEVMAAILSSYLTKSNKAIVGPAILDCLQTY